LSNTAVESFFDDAVRSGAPSASFKNIGDFVIGEVVDQYQIEATDFATGEVLKDKKTGETIMQLVIVLQTELRNWDRVAKIPKVDSNDRNSADKPASEDDGKRAIYVKKYTNIHAAIGGAVVAATGQKGPVRNGGTLGVEFFKDEDRGKGNPLKHYRAKYTAPVPAAASANGFFDGAASSVGNQEPQQSSQPASQPAPQQHRPAQQDPWASQPASSERTSEPPF